MRTFVLLLVLFLSKQFVYSVPADRVPRNVAQLDGSLLTICQYGDEFFHYLMTKDGLVVKDSSDGGYYYAVFKEGLMHPSKVLAHNPNLRNKFENQFVRCRVEQGYDTMILDSVQLLHRQKVLYSNGRRQRKSHRVLGVPTQYIGSKKGLVILVEFPNLIMKSQTANADHIRMFNEVGYSENNHVGSVHDYFFDQSYGKFDLTFDVVGPVTVRNNYGYYGTDGMGGNHDMNVKELIKEACILADEYVNYKTYDWDSDGTVDQVFIIYAGYGQATGGATNTIWPHESMMTEDLVLDGVKISQYACSNELYRDGVENKDRLMGIGTACHEFSHCLGLPDLYDTDYSGAYGMSYWSLMNSGSYSGPNGVGEVPYGYSAYERWFSGWIEIEELKTSQKVEDMPDLGQSPIAYKIVNSAYPDEFFTLENHQPNKWFSYVGTFSGMHGLLITHVDFSSNAWKMNRVNPNTEHQRMSPIVADNNYSSSYDGLAGDLFPGKGNIMELTNASHVSYGGHLFNTNTDGTYNMNISVIDIKEDNGAVSFNVVHNEEIPTPTALPATNITSTSFTAVWTDSGVDCYLLEAEVVKSLKPFISEIVTIENITGTHYSLTDLNATYCNYKVRAIKNGIGSEWSNTIAVKLNNYNGIEVISVEDNNARKIYNLRGMQVETPLQGGIYIISGGAYQKKIVKRYD